MVDEKYIFEIGGKNKSFKQIANMPHSFQGNFASQPLFASFVVADDIEIGSGNKIPIWLFGFLY